MLSGKEAHLAPSEAEVRGIDEEEEEGHSCL